MSEEELKAIEERANNAQAGPWTRGSWLSNNELTTQGAFGQYVSGPAPFEIIGEDDYGPVLQEVEDAEFIAHSRTDVPALINEIRRLKRQIHGYS